jgi:C-terminal processing protease CtpA/Prc
MKIRLLLICCAVAMPVMVSGQMYGPTDEGAAKLKPVEPVRAKDHAGPGRIGVRLAFPKELGGMPQIVGMTRGGPAADAGFCIGDVIVKIDKNYTTSLSQDEVRLALHGEPGFGVELTVQRGDDPHLIVRAAERRVLTMDAEDIPLPQVTEAKP